MSFLTAQPIRRQVIAATGILLVPFLSVAFWGANRTRLEREHDVEDEARSVAAAAATHLNEYLNGLDSLASALVRHSAVIALDRDAADRLFTDVLRYQPLLLNLMLSDSDGRVKGSALPTNDSVLSMPYPRVVLESGRPAVSEVMAGQFSKKPAIVLAYPVSDDQHRVVGVLGLALNLEKLETLFHLIPLPDGSVVTMVDSSSRVLARTLDPERYIGTIVDEANRPAAAVGIRTGPDGVERCTRTLLWTAGDGC